MTQRELVDQVAGLAGSRASRDRSGSKDRDRGPVPGQRHRFIADGCDTRFIRDNLERDRDGTTPISTRAKRSSRHRGLRSRLRDDGTLLGMLQMFANMTDPSRRSVHGDGAARDPHGAVVANPWCLPLADKLHQAGRRGDQPHLIIDGVL
jgi:chemotaxis protein MotA